MKAIATAGNGQGAVGSVNSHGGSYTKVIDGRKQPVRGLWQRNGAFYARLDVETASGTKKNCRVRLVDAAGVPVKTVPEAVKSLAKLRDKRDTNDLPALRLCPKLADAVAAYLDFFSKVTDAKRPRTLQKERGCLALWVTHMGGIRVDKIKRAHVNDFIAKRQAAGISGRTANLDVIALRSVLKRARDDGHLRALPTDGLRPLKWIAKKRHLVTAADIERLADAGLTASKNGQQLADYIRVLAYCGSRRDETLRLKWSDVDFEQGLLTVGSDGLAKNHEHRTVDFNAKLDAHLRDMFARRAPDSDFLFPSPLRGDRDASTKTFKESLALARAAAALPTFTFHDCRHAFISYAVMSGIDFMTIAKWVGHKDGGVLIGKVYGHLANEHRKLQASRIRFGVEVVSLEAVNG